MIRRFLIAAALFAGCPRAPDVSALAEADAGVDAGPPVVDAGVRAPELLAFRLVATQVDGGVVEFDGLDGGLTLDPARTLELSASVGLEGARVRLLDWTDAVVPSDDTLESSDAGFRYRIELLQPLKTGRSYSLLVDSESAERVSDTFGREFDEWRLGLKVSGEVQPEPGQAAKKTKKNRR